MERLLAGEPIRSDGKLTIKSLAAEAGVKRWLLTHRHTDLQDEFRDRVRAQDATPTAIAALHEQIAELKEAQKQDRAALRDAVARTEIHAHETQVLVLENDKLRLENEKLSKQASGAAAGPEPTPADAVSRARDGASNLGSSQALRHVTRHGDWWRGGRFNPGGTRQQPVA